MTIDKRVFSWYNECIDKKQGRGTRGIEMDTNENEIRGMTAAQRLAAWRVAANTTWAGSKPLADLIKKIADENNEKLTDSNKPTGD